MIYRTNCDTDLLDEELDKITIDKNTKSSKTLRSKV